MKNINALREMFTEETVLKLTVALIEAAESLNNLCEGGIFAGEPEDGDIPEEISAYLVRLNGLAARVFPVISDIQPESRRDLLTELEADIDGIIDLNRVLRLYFVELRTLGDGLEDRLISVNFEQLGENPISEAFLEDCVRFAFGGEDALEQMKNGMELLKFFPARMAKGRLSDYIREAIGRTVNGGSAGLTRAVLELTAENVMPDAAKGYGSKFTSIASEISRIKAEIAKRPDDDEVEGLLAELVELDEEVSGFISLAEDIFVVLKNIIAAVRYAPARGEFEGEIAEFSEVEMSWNELASGFGTDSFPGLDEAVMERLNGLGDAYEKRYEKLNHELERIDPSAFDVEETEEGRAFIEAAKTSLEIDLFMAYYERCFEVGLIDESDDDSASEDTIRNSIDAFIAGYEAYMDKLSPPAKRRFKQMLIGNVFCCMEPEEFRDYLRYSLEGAKSSQRYLTMYRVSELFEESGFGGEEGHIHHHHHGDACGCGHEHSHGHEHHHHHGDACGCGHEHSHGHGHHHQHDDNCGCGHEH